MAELIPAPQLSERGILIGHAEMIRALLILLVIREVIDREFLEGTFAEVLGGIRERGYDPRHIPDAEEYIRNLLDTFRQQISEIERLGREREKPN